MAAAAPTSSPSSAPWEPPARLGGRQSPAYVDRDPVSLGVTSLMRINARVLASQLPPGPLVDPDELTGLDALVDAWTTVRAEWDALRARVDRMPKVDDLIQRGRGWDGDWESYGIRGTRGWFDHARRNVPETVRLLEGVGGLVQASFSVLSPGGSLYPHRGPNTGVVRGLLGVVVDDPSACGLVVGHERLEMAEGRCLTFDDTFEHVSWNRGTTDRVALLLEIRWPTRGVGRLVNRATQRAFRHHPMVERGNRRFVELLEDPAQP